MLQAQYGVYRNLVDFGEPIVRIGKVAYIYGGEGISFACRYIKHSREFQRNEEDIVVSIFQHVPKSKFLSFVPAAGARNTCIKYRIWKLSFFLIKSKNIQWLIRGTSNSSNEGSLRVTIEPFSKSYFIQIISQNYNNL